MLKLPQFQRNFMKQNRSKHSKSKNSWDHLANWYSGWTGAAGSDYQQKVAFPSTIEMLDLKPNDRLLDVGCGTGVFSSYFKQSKINYFGIDVSKQMISIAKKEFYRHGKFYNFDILDIKSAGDFRQASFDAACFVLSIQDMPNLDETIANTARLIKKDGKLVIFMKHPAFNIPRQTGWIEDKARKLFSRRVDRYLSSNQIPVFKKIGKKSITTFHYHRPLERYFTALVQNGFSIFDLNEIPDNVKKGEHNKEFPQFLVVGGKKW